MSWVLQTIAHQLICVIPWEDKKNKEWEIREEYLGKRVNSQIQRCNSMFQTVRMATYIVSLSGDVPDKDEIMTQSWKTLVPTTFMTKRTLKRIGPLAHL